VLLSGCGSGECDLEKTSATDVIEVDDAERDAAVAMHGGLNRDACTELCRDVRRPGLTESCSDQGPATGGGAPRSTLSCVTDTTGACD
jgi:hypothetical protein